MNGAEERLSLSPSPFALAAGVLILSGLYLTSRYNYLLFHTVAELFSIAVAWGVFLLAWNSRRYYENSYLLVISTSLVFVGLIDLLHTLAYKGMGVFPGADANLPTQLWIAGRYLQAFSFFGASLILHKKIRLSAVFSAYAVLTALLLASIFFWKIFPDCYVEGGGLTSFKRTSEYVIAAILFLSVVQLYGKRAYFEREVLYLLIMSIGLSVLSELAFTAYISVSGTANMLGHFFKIIAFYMLYKAIIEVGIAKPYNLLFRSLKKNVEALRESEARLQYLASFPQLNPNPIAEVKMSGEISFVNEAVLKVLETLGPDTKDPKVFLPSDFAEIVRNLDKEPEGIMYREVVIKDRVFGASINRVPQSDSLRIYAFDITERKRIENALLESEERLRLAHHVAKIGAFEWNIQTGMNVWTPDLEEMYGLDPGEFGRTQAAWEQLVHPEDRATAVGRVNKAFETGEPVEGEWRVVWRDGSVHWISGRFQVFRDMSGKPLRLTGVNIDITERKLAEQALRKSLERYRSFIEVTGQLGWTTTAVGEVVEDLPSWRAYTGQTFEELKGWGWTKAVHPEDLENAVRKWKAALAEKSSYETEYRIRKHDGSYRYFMARGIPLFETDGSIREWVGTCIDITERKQTEEQIRKNMAELQAINDELARFNRVAVDRELRMIELKKEINELCNNAGKKARYALYFPDE